MIALTGILGTLHLAQERIHLFGFQAASGADRPVTGNTACDRKKIPLERQRVVPFGDVFREIAYEIVRVRLAEQRRRFAHKHRALPERLQDKAELRKFFGVRNE